MKILFIGGKTRFGLSPFITSQANSLRLNGVIVDEFVWNNKFLLFFPQLFRLYKQIIFGKYQIIHCHYIYFFVYVFPFSLFKPVILSFMGSDLYGIFNEDNKLRSIGKFNVIISRIFSYLPSGIIVKSERMMEYLPISVRSKAIVLPNGVDFNFFNLKDQKYCCELLGLSKNSFKILFLGDKNDPRKNYKFLNEIRKCFKLIDDIEIISPFPVEKEKIPFYMNACNVLCLPSLIEGSPNVVKEALVCNLPVISTDVGDVSTMLNGFPFCYICDLDVNKWVSCILSINEAKTFGYQYREKLTFISSSNISKKLIEFYIKIYNKN